MSEPQQPGDSAGATSNAGEDSGNRPASSAAGGGFGNSASGSRGSSPNSCGPFNKRGRNYNQKPYPRSDYGNQDQTDDPNPNQQRQERDFTKRTDFQERNPRYFDERFSGRNTDYNYRNYNRKKKSKKNRDKLRRSPYQWNRRDGDNSFKSPPRYDESGLDLNTVTPNDLKKEHSCESKSDSQTQEHQSDQVHHNEQVASERNDKEQSTVASEERTIPSPITNNEEFEKAHEALQAAENTPSREEPYQRSGAQLLGEELSLSNSSENTSTTESSQPIQLIKCRPLTQLLRQELFAVTQENHQSKPFLLSPSPSASPIRPNFIANQRYRRRTVSRCNYNGGSFGQAEDDEEIINDRIASMDKESLKYIINNSDTIYEEHLQLQARRRIRDVIRQQLKSIELEQPKDNCVEDLVEDEIVDAIKLPDLLLQEIQKCFGINISEGQRATTSKVDNQAKTKSKNSVESSRSVKDNEGSKKGCNEAVNFAGTSRVSKEVTNVKESRNTIKDSTTIETSEDSRESTISSEKNNSITASIQYNKLNKVNHHQNKEVEEINNIIENAKNVQYNSIKSIRDRKKDLQERIRKRKERQTKKLGRTIQENDNTVEDKSNAQIPEGNDPHRARAFATESTYSLKRSRYLAPADEVNTLPGLCQAKTRTALLPTPTEGRLPNWEECSNSKKKKFKPSHSPIKKAKKLKTSIEYPNFNKNENSSYQSPLPKSKNETTVVSRSENFKPIECPNSNQKDCKPSQTLNKETKRNSDEESTMLRSPFESITTIKMKIKSESSSLPTKDDHELPSLSNKKITSIERESSSSPIIVVPLPSMDVIELMSSSDENDKEDNFGAVDMDLDETEEEALTQNGEQSLEVLPRPEPPVMDNADSNHSTSSQCSSESTKRRHKLKLQSDAENVVDSFEKLILPNLREALTDRYRRQHSSSLQSRLHFISCVVTSSEHNSRSFSKIEVAKMQMNLKAADNGKAIEFLLKEIVNVVSLQKQRRREQDDEQKLANSLSPKNTKSPVKAAPNASSSPSVERSPTALSPHQCSSASTSHQSTQCSPALLSNTKDEDIRQSPSPSRKSPSLLPNSQKHDHITIGLPYLTLDPNLHHFPSGTYPRLGVGSHITEPLDQSLVDIDRRLLENQNRRSILEEMIMKFQKEKSDLEMVGLELQSRKFLLLNSMISRGVPSAASTVSTRISPPPAENSQDSTQEESSSRGGIARRTRSRTRLRTKVVKLLPKRQVRIQKRVVKRNKSAELIAQLQEEIAHQDECNKKREEQDKEKDLRLSIQSNNEEKPMNESNYEQKTDSLPSVKPTQSRLNKPKANPTHQPLAIIPPLSPPPPPPEPICHMSFDIPRGHHWSELNSREQYRNGFVRKGKLREVLSPITQIKIYREYVIAAAEDGDIYMFHLVSHKLILQVTKHSEAITNMCLNEKDSTLYTTSLDGFFKKSSLQNLERVIETVYFKEPLQSIDIAWGLVFIGSRWGIISTFNDVTNKVMDMPLVSTGQSIIAIKATKEGVRKIIVLGCKGNFVQIHDAANGLLLRRLCIPDGLNVYSLLLNDGHIYCGTQKNEIYQLEFNTGVLVKKLSCGNGAVGIVSYKERYLLVGCYDGFIYVLDKVTGAKMGRFEGAGRLVLALTVAGDKIVTSSKDTSLEILEVPAAMINGH
ncbi:uncharacterized protein LOC108111566 isoform X2 [Drosophila eugracilis]|uniref:uncharacterized protein LOC108111566 isoform X2 n=1 Tax=Drosophila eugracilis TaxID=29029 RepID=UPI001BDA1BA8|nr:uncharacterized protein LOC108111566 isoform X2 [Drosophila eugracilis]